MNRGMLRHAHAHVSKHSRNRSYTSNRARQREKSKLSYRGKVLTDDVHAGYGRGSIRGLQVVHAKNVVDVRVGRALRAARRLCGLPGLALVLRMLRARGRKRLGGRRRRADVDELVHAVLVDEGRGQPFVDAPRKDQSSLLPVHVRAHGRHVEAARSGRGTGLQGKLRWRAARGETTSYGGGGRRQRKGLVR